MEKEIKDTPEVDDLDPVVDDEPEVPADDPDRDLPAEDEPEVPAEDATDPDKPADDERPGKYAERIAKGQGHNVDAEMKRLQDKIAEMESSMKSAPDKVDEPPKPAKAPAHFVKLRDKLHAQGLDDIADEIEAAIKAESYSTAKAQTSAFEGPAREAGLKSNLDTLSAEPKYKMVMEKFRAEIEKEIRKAPKEFWNNPALAKSVMGQFVADNLDTILAKPAAQKKPNNPGKISETQKPGGAGSQMSGVTRGEVEDYANENMLDTSDPEIKKTIIDTLKKKKELEKLKEEKRNVQKT